MNPFGPRRKANMIAGALVAAADTAVQTSTPAVFTWPGFFMSPGFGGAAALSAAALGGGIALYLGYKAKGTEDDKLAQTKIDGELDRCWERFVWAVDNEGMALYVLQSLLIHLSHDAKRLGDQALLKVIEEYNGELLASLRDNSAQ